MPELPEAEAARRLAQRVLVGRRLVEVAAREDPIVFAGTSARRVAAWLRGRHVVAARRKGKHNWLELDRRPWPAFHFWKSLLVRVVLGAAGGVGARPRSRRPFFGHDLRFPFAVRGRGGAHGRAAPAGRRADVG